MGPDRIPALGHAGGRSMALFEHGRGPARRMGAPTEPIATSTSDRHDVGAPDRRIHPLRARSSHGTSPAGNRRGAELLHGGEQPIAFFEGYGKFLREIGEAAAHGGGPL